MTPAETLASYRAALAEVGEDIVIRRYSGEGTSQSPTDTPARARVMGYQPQELIGSIVQGDRQVIVLVDSAVSAILPILKTDKLVIRGGKDVAIKAVDDNTRRINGVLIALDITAAG